MDDAALLEAARSWARSDIEPADRDELTALVAAGDVAELRERFSSPLTFGTAGLRGLVGAGPARMNRAVVARTTRGLAEHLLAATARSGTSPGPVVIGHDARLSSRALADAAAGVLVAAGIPVRYFPGPVPTPLVAYATRALAASAGIVITASHNPGEYNGYKLYGGLGIQVVPPVDGEVERRAEAAGPASSIPYVPGTLDGASPSAAAVHGSVVDAYVSDVLATVPDAGGARDLSVVYTPVHGVGGPLVSRLLAARRFGQVHVVVEQEAPDGRFPTARFPNPEDPRVLELALRDARALGADLVLANDPDADRLAAAVPDGDGGWVALTGNQIGVLLADLVLRWQAPGGRRALVVSTVVSSPMVLAVARARGAETEETLTGFKWIWTAAAALEEARGLRFVFGCEEAIGFSVGGTVRDKDGMGAALAMAEIAADCRRRGTSVLAELERLEAEVGLWVSVQRSVVREGAAGRAEIDAAVNRLASSPPDALAGFQTRQATDLRRGHGDRPAWLGATPLVRLEMAPRCRVIVRPSGTEPKLKIYVDLEGELGDGSHALARRDAERRAQGVATAMVQHLGLT